MRTFLYAAGLAGVMATFSVMAAQAGPCDGVKREMAFGEAAAEDAKDKAGFKRAAEQFNNATTKAPNCAAAFYNLGIVLENADDFVRAKHAFEKYLKLAPQSPDAGAVEKKIFKLEYRINTAAKHQQVAAAARQRDEALARRLAGKWANPPLVFPSPQNFGNCRLNRLERGYLTEFKVSGTKVEGIVIGTPYINTSSCKAYFTRAHVPHITGTIENGRLKGKKYDVRYGGGSSGHRYGSAKSFEWEIVMSSNGRSFTINPINDQNIKAGNWTSKFSKW